VRRLLAVFNILLYYMVRSRVRLEKNSPQQSLLRASCSLGQLPQANVIIIPFSRPTGKSQISSARWWGSVGWQNE